MEELIELENLIEEAKKRGIDFGKGDPYNRLRYYTKIGWLPHMTRKKDSDGNISGHYPTWVLERLVEIEKLKADGASNDFIEKKLKITGKWHSVLDFLKSKETRNQALVALIVFVVGLIFLSELGIVKIGHSKSQLIDQQVNQIPNQIISSGTSFIPKGQRKVYVKEENVTSTSKIYVTFTQDYAPAVRYWTENINEFDGFSVVLDTPSSSNVEFNWWVSN